MSLFADKWSAFDISPFGLDSFHSTTFGGSHLGEGFGDTITARLEARDRCPSTMRFRHGPSLAERGFYDDFDSYFHDLRPLSTTSRRHFAEDRSTSSRRPTASSGKERIIPIKIETSSDKAGESLSCKPGKKIPELNLQNDRENGFRGRMIDIPIRIVRESQSGANSHNISSKENARSPSKFTLLTPTTDEFKSTLRRRTTKEGEFDDIIYLDSDDFFTQPESSIRSSRSKPGHDLLDIIDVDGQEEETLCRKPLRYLENEKEARSKKYTLHHEDTESDSKNFSSTPSRRHAHSDTKNNDVKFEKRKPLEQKVTEGESRPPQCSHSGVTNVTPPPSYPIYDHLRPRLASVGRQVDYIRGDGNCFFRAVSKEMYGSEGYHAEWRQAVCDLIESHPAVFAQYVDGGADSLAAHVREMRVLSTWATTCEIYATATLLRREVYVLAPTPGGDTTASSSEAQYTWLLFSPRSLSGPTAGNSASKVAFTPKKCQRPPSPSPSSSSDSDSSSGGRGGGRGRGRGSPEMLHYDTVHPCYLTLCHTNGNHYDRIIPIFQRCNCEMAPPCLNGVSMMLDLTASDEEELMHT